MSSKDLNKVMITGRLGKDPEMRFTPQGSAVTSFSVASNRSWKSADGQAHEEVEWFSVVVWNKLAEICNQYLAKGSRVYIEGRLQTRSWEDSQTGEKRYKTEVVASDMIMLDGRKEAAPAYDGEEDEEPEPAPAPRAAPARPAPTRAAAPAREKLVLEEQDLPF